MDEQGRPEIPRWRTGLRCAPFAAIILCLLLPLFTVSSCSDNQQATATGVDVLLGTRIMAQATAADSHGPAEVQAEAQAMSRATRPWAIVTVALAVLGIVLMLNASRHHRPISAGISVATGVAVIMIWRAVSAPSDDGTPDAGLLLLSLILLLSVAWQACIFTWLALAHAIRPRTNRE